MFRSELHLLGVVRSVRHRLLRSDRFGWSKLLPLKLFRITIIIVSFMPMNARPDFLELLDHLRDNL
jgi:hypothetical protein